VSFKIQGFKHSNFLPVFNKLTNFFHMKVIFFYLLLLLTFPAFGQEKVNGLVLFVNGGIHHLNTDGLNQALDNTGFDGNFRSLYTTTGGGAHFYLKNLVLGTSGKMMAFDRRKSQDRTTTFTSGSANIYFGYSLFSDSRVIFFPSLGLGFITSLLNVREVPRQGSFDDVLRNPDLYAQRNARMVNLAPFLRPAINVDFFPFPRQRNGTTKGMIIGLSAGYTLSTNGRWYMNGSRVEGAPEFNPSGLFLSLRLGGGYITRRIKS
jgi:hypothetical protein